ncbi:hypothetical protein LCGC14_0181930 [marine sediment metagenome]|uniref:Uncharacterized protein n=1 Tax=marine sediment metagenome TaxID=412755 RepID=A0A0F9UTV0_9ZZZZ|nr:hypothetical protein [Phycisphaerae bacterium]HDZ43096.1 hypothetical protein [Phycisphaerae bacterium]
MTRYEEMKAAGVMPISFWLYGGSWDEGALAQWKDLGCSVVMTPHSYYPPAPIEPSLKMLDDIHEAGMKAIFCDGRVTFGPDAVKRGGAAMRKRIKEAVRDFGHHPGMLGFHAGDEPTTGLTESAVQTLKLHREVAPHLSTFLNFGPYSRGVEGWIGEPDYSAFLDRVCRDGKPEYLIHDVYWQMAPGDGSINGYFGSIKMYSDAARRHGIDWMVSPLACGHFTYRCPTEDDFRWQVGTALAHGAKGLCWFLLGIGMGYQNYRISPIDEHGERTETFTWVSRINRTTQALYGPLVMTLTLKNVWHQGHVYGGFEPFHDSHLLKWAKCPNPLILSEFVDPDGREYFSVCNNSQTESCQAVLAFRGRPTIYQASGGGESPAKVQTKGDITGTFAWLAPGQITFYRIDYAGKRPKVPHISAGVGPGEQVLTGTV